MSVRIPDPFDHDFLSFQAAAGQHFRFSCDWKETPGQVQVYADFRDAEGNGVEYSRAHLGDRWVQTFTPSKTGTYSIDLWADNAAVLGTSSCEFEVLAP